MGNMALFASSTSEPKVSIRPKSDIIHRYAPELDFTLRYSNAIGSALFGESRYVFIHAFLTVKSFLAWSAAALRQATWFIWETKPIRRLRKKLEFEFFVLILGFGNGLVLVAFWPGWLFLAMITYFVWSWGG